MAKVPLGFASVKDIKGSSWHIATCKDVHTCPPRRDNSLVTSRRIADKYEKLILANPQWSVESMREIIQQEIFADVSISKIKRAKSIVMQRMYDATKGEYALVFDY